MKESIEECKFQAAQLALSKSSQKQNGFSYSKLDSVRGIIEKKMDGLWHKGGGSFYMWVHKPDG